MNNLIKLIIEKKIFILNTVLLTFFLKFISSSGVIIFNITILFLSDKNILGLFTIGLSILTFSSIISRIGLNSAIIRFTSITIHEKKTLQFKNEIVFSFLFSIFTSFIIFMLIIIFEDFIVYNIYKNEQLRKVIFLFALSIPLYSIILIQKSLFNSFRYSQLVSVSDLGTVLLITTIIAIISEYLIGINLTIYRLCIYFLISNLILILFLSIILINLILSKFIEKFETRSFSIDSVFVKSLPNYFLIDLSNYFFIWGTIFIASFLLNSIDLATFSTIFLLALSLNFISITLNSIFSPILSVKFKKDDYEGLFKKIHDYRNISLFINVPIIAFSLFFAEEILFFIFDNSSNVDILIFRLLIITHCLKIFSGPLILLYNLIGREIFIRNLSLITVIIHLSLITCFSYFSTSSKIIISISYFITLFVKYLIINISYMKFKKDFI